MPGDGTQHLPVPPRDPGRPEQGQTRRGGTEFGRFGQHVCCLGHAFRRSRNTQFFPHCAPQRQLPREVRRDATVEPIGIGAGSPIGDHLGSLGAVAVEQVGESPAEVQAAAQSAGVIRTGQVRGHHVVPGGGPRGIQQVQDHPRQSGWVPWIGLGFGSCRAERFGGDFLEQVGGGGERDAGAHAVAAGCPGPEPLPQLLGEEPFHAPGRDAHRLWKERVPPAGEVRQRLCQHGGQTIDEGVRAGTSVDVQRHRAPSDGPPREQSRRRGRGLSLDPLKESNRPLRRPARPCPPAALLRV